MTLQDCVDKAYIRYNKGRSRRDQENICLDSLMDRSLSEVVSESEAEEITEQLIIDTAYWDGNF